MGLQPHSPGIATFLSWLVCPKTHPGGGSKGAFGGSAIQLAQFEPYSLHFPSLLQRAQPNDPLCGVKTPQRSTMGKNKLSGFCWLAARREKPHPKQKYIAEVIDRIGQDPQRLWFLFRERSALYYAFLCVMGIDEKA